MVHGIIRGDLEPRINFLSFDEWKKSAPETKLLVDIVTDLRTAGGEAGSKDQVGSE